MLKPTLLTASLAFSLSFSAHANDDWAKTEQAAKGQTVYFNAWGGGDNINAYIDWAANEVKDRYNVTVKHVKITDAAEVVKRIQTEKEAGRDQKGSVDLMWVNGENFRNLKQNGLLAAKPWAETLPNWQYVDTQKPVRQDFSESTDGLESPWGTAQLTFIANKAQTPEPPTSANDLLSFAEANKGRVSYPQPPEFHGTTFLKQLLIELSEDASVLQKEVSKEQFTQVTAPLWAYLDELHPSLWREGKSFPKSVADMHQMLADGELKLSMTFNPNEGASLVANERLPKTAYSFGFTKGTIGNTHFVAIPFNAKAEAGAKVFANFLLSPEAQAKKADVAVWGDPSVLDMEKLSEAQRKAFVQSAKGGLEKSVPTLPEPHASWVEALEKEWVKRYGS